MAPRVWACLDVAFRLDSAVALEAIRDRALRVDSELTAVDIGVFLSEGLARSGSTRTSNETFENRRAAGRVFQQSVSQRCLRLAAK
jgi:hypothetical protein